MDGEERRGKEGWGRATGTVACVQIHFYCSCVGLWGQGYPQGVPVLITIIICVTASVGCLCVVRHHRSPTIPCVHPAADHFMLPLTAHPITPACCSLFPSRRCALSEFPGCDRARLPRPRSQTQPHTQDCGAGSHLTQTQQRPCALWRWCLCCWHLSQSQCWAGRLCC